VPARRRLPAPGGRSLRANTAGGWATFKGDFGSKWMDNGGNKIIGKITKKNQIY
jgi:hypothetical protein